MTQKNVFDDPFDYAEMVESLFKKADKQSEMLIHAAVGVCGEAIEFEAAVREFNVENAIEELGDMAFYIHKILNLYDLNTPEGVLVREFDELLEQYIEDDTKKIPNLVDRIVHRSGELLDLSKKIWVYEDESKTNAMIASLFCVMDYIMNFVDQHPILGSLENIKQRNREKLSKRYPQGVFTNKDAQERKDKQ